MIAPLLGPGISIMVRTGPTDMRKSINGLSLMVEQELQADPFSGGLFAFCNRRRNIVKIIYWDKNGFCLWHKRLEKDLFPWPKHTDETLCLRPEQLFYLLQGVDPFAIKGHAALSYTRLS